MELEVLCMKTKQADWLEMGYEELTNQTAILLIFDKDSILLERKSESNVGSSEEIKTENKTMPLHNKLMSAFIPIHKIPKELWDTALKYYLGKLNFQEIYSKELQDEEPQSEIIHPVFAIESKMLSEERVNAAMAGNSFTKVPLRIFLEKEPQKVMQYILRAKQLLHWHKTSLFCGSCGGRTQHSDLETAKICLNCDRIIYPHTSPAVVVLISKGDEILLARSPHFRPSVYSVIAGFVEAGESAEDTVIREIAEEVQIKVKNIRYFGSQSWPFENSFMMAFIAEYDSGEIIMHSKEIEDARWFRWDNLPSLPYRSSLSRLLIDEYITLKKDGKL